MKSIWSFLSLCILIFSIPVLASQKKITPLADDLGEVKLSSDALHFAAAKNDQLQVYSTETMQLEYVVSLETVLGSIKIDQDKIKLFSFSNTSRYLFVAVSTGDVIIIEVASGNVIRRLAPEKEQTVAVQWSDDDSVFSLRQAGSYPTLVYKLYRTSDLKDTGLIIHANSPLTFSRDSKKLYFADVGSLTELDLGTLKSREVVKLNSNNNLFASISVNADRSLLATCGLYGSSKAGVIEFWDVLTGQERGLSVADGNCLSTQFISGLPNSVFDVHRGSVISMSNPENKIVPPDFNFMWPGNHQQYYMYPDYAFSTAQGKILIRYTDGGRPKGSVAAIWNVATGSLQAFDDIYEPFSDFGSVVCTEDLSHIAYVLRSPGQRHQTLVQIWP